MVAGVIGLTGRGDAVGSGAGFEPPPDSQFDWIQPDDEVSSRIDYLFDYSFRLLDDDSGTYTHHLVTTL